MLYNSYKQKKLAALKLRFIKPIMVAIVLIGSLILLCSCTLLTKQLDDRTGFSMHLAQVENRIRQEEWQQAKTGLEDAKNIWEKLKPIMQVDIDHDYVKEIEDGFVKLGGYIDAQDKSQSLASILLLEDTWKNVDSF